MSVAFCIMPGAASGRVSDNDAGPTASGFAVAPVSAPGARLASLGTLHGALHPAAIENPVAVAPGLSVAERNLAYDSIALNVSAQLDDNIDYRSGIRDDFGAAQVDARLKGEERHLFDGAGATVGVYR